MSGYHLIITILDRSRPNCSRQILRGSASTRSAGRTPHPTVTGLPGELDFRIANTPSYVPTSFWTDLSQAPTTRLGERFDKLEQVSPVSPTTLWYEPDSILPSATTGPSSFTPAPTLDYRFGPISLDWIDHPANHPAFHSVSTPLENQKHNTPDLNLQKIPGMAQSIKSRQSTTLTPNYAQPSTSSMPDQIKYQNQSNLPVAQFITESPEKAKYQLGSTELGYGSIHLYRNFEEASDTTRASSSSPLSLHQKSNQEVGANVPQNEFMELDDENQSVVGILAIPSYMTSQDFLAFISSVFESIESVRMLRDSLPNRCIGLIKFRTYEAARSFAGDFDGKPFSHLQDREICHTAFIRSVRFKSSLIPPFTFPALLPPDLLVHSAHELPTCPVCLERMDATVTGLMTKTCSHTFHCHCLSNWGDSRCPICRYSESKLSQSFSPEQSECAACGSQANLWICLICGHIGCGRYQGGHAYRHFEESAHSYALELGTQRIWDYVGDNYVHRLIQTKSDQIVELPALSSAVFDSGGGSRRNDAAQQSKIEAISEEFGHLVASQLDSQRVFYEEEIEILRSKLKLTQQETDKQKKVIQELQAQVGNVKESAQSLEKNSKKKKSAVASRTDKNLLLSQRLDKELKDEQAMSLGMQLQIKKLEEEKNEEKKKTTELSNEIVEIKDQLRDLMFFIEMQSKIKNNEAGGSELEGGSIVIKNNPSSILKPENKGKKGGR